MVVRGRVDWMPKCGIEDEIEREYCGRRRTRMISHRRTQLIP